MYNLFTISKKKTYILGLWQDEKGRVYRDKIKIVICKNPKELNREILTLFNKGEKAVFYKADNIAYIESKEGKIEALKHCIKWHENKLRPSFIKALLNQHNGLTIYKAEKGYTLEIWKS